MDSITELQYGVLDGMMDDAEDVEQLYLGLRDQFTLREVVDTAILLLRDGMIEVKYTNDERIAQFEAHDTKKGTLAGSSTCLIPMILGLTKISILSLLC